MNNNDRRIQINEHGMSDTGKDTYVPVSCVRCGESIGYVVATGHTTWLCESCGDGKFVAVDDSGQAETPAGIKKQIADIIYRVAVDAANSKPIDELQSAVEILRMVEDRLTSKDTIAAVSRATNYASIPTRLVLTIAFSSITDEG